MNKHSDGPWAIQDNAAHGVHIYSEGGMFGGGKHVARVSNSAGVDMLANARLIAAAPSMLDALERAEQQLDYGQYDAAMGILRAAITAAREP
jgi:hypothetical protein